MHAAQSPHEKAIVFRMPVADGRHDPAGEILSEIEIFSPFIVLGTLPMGATKPDDIRLVVPLTYRLANKTGTVWGARASGAACRAKAGS